MKLSARPRAARAHLPMSVLLLVLAAGVLSPQLAAARAHPPRSLFFSLRSASSPPELTVSFEQAAVDVSQVTPGGDVVFFALAREPQGTFNKVVRLTEIVPADSLGEARLDMDSGEAVPFKSVWAVVDLATGHYGLAAPGDFPLSQIAFPGRGFERGAPGLVNRLRQRFTWAYTLLVRPGVGAWVLHSGDGGADDEDGTSNGSLVTGLEALEPIGATPPPPDRYAAGDVLVVVNPRDLRLYATRLLGPPQ